MLLNNRLEAGQLLAERCHSFNPDWILALPRGGVPVAYPIANALDCPLDVFLVRKLGVPGHEELAFGAIASGDITVLNQTVVTSMGITPSQMDQVKATQSAELQRREQVYRQGKPALSLQGQSVMLVDDGVATGSTMLAAIAALKATKPAEIIAVFPVAASDSFAEIKQHVDQIVCLHDTLSFGSISQFYREFDQVSDQEVLNYLQGV